MRGLNIDTGIYYNVVSVDYDTGIVVLETTEGVRTQHDLNRIRLLTGPNEDLKGKTIIHPKAFWMIPFVGWFMFLFSLITVKNSVILTRGVKEQTIAAIAAYWPIVLFFLYCSYYIFWTN